MTVNVGILAILTVIGAITLSVAQLVGGVIALFFGGKVRWLWAALAAYNFVSKALLVALYREPSLTRIAGSLVVGAMAAAAAILFTRRFPTAVLVIGGFLASAMIVVQAFGPLLNPAPEWLVLGITVAAGVVGVRLALRYTEVAEIVLSALVGAGIVAATLTDTMHIDESLRFQVYIVLALVGIGFQLWRTRRVAAAQAEFHVPAGM